MKILIYYLLILKTFEFTDQLEELLYHGTDKKQILGNMFSLAGGQHMYKELGPQFMEENQSKMIEEGIFNMKSRSNSLLVDRSNIIGEIDRLISDCGEKIDLIKSAGVNSILSITAIIEKANKGMQKSIDVYSKVLKGEKIKKI